MPQRPVADPLDDLLKQIDQTIGPDTSAPGATVQKPAAPNLDALLGEIDSAIGPEPQPAIGQRPFPKGANAGGTFVGPVQVTPAPTGPSLKETVAARPSRADAATPPSGNWRPNEPIQRSRTGTLYQTPPMGASILDTPAMGVRQIGEGVGKLAAAASPNNPLPPAPTGPVRVSSKTGMRYQDPPPIDPRTYAGAADIVEGAMGVGTVALPAAAVAAPIGTAVAITTATLASKGTEKVMQEAGATPEQTRLASAVVGAVAAGVPVGRILRKGLSATAETARTAGDRAVSARDASSRIEPLPTDINIAPARQQLPADVPMGQAASPQGPLVGQVPPTGPPVAVRPGSARPVAAGPVSAPVPPPVAPPAVPVETLDAIVADIDTAIGPLDETGRDLGGYAGPDRRTAARVSTPDQDEQYQRMREKVAAGEPTGTEESRADLAERKRVEEARRQGAVNEINALGRQIDEALASSTKPDREFSSTQIEIPAEHAAAVRSLAAKIPDADLAEDGREDRPHVTVKFGLHTNDAEEVRRVLAGEPPIKVRLGKTSLFPAKEGADYDVVKVDVDSPDLHRLNAKIAGALKATDTHPEYKPHTTLAYVRPGLGKKYEGDASLEGREITVDAVTFSGKDRTETVIPLGGQNAGDDIIAQIDSAIGPADAPAPQPVPDRFTDLPPLERREVRRILKELESYGYEGRTRTVIAGAPKGQDEIWTAGHGGAPVFNDVMDGRAGKRATAQRAITAYVSGKKPSKVAVRAVEIARRRLAGDPHLAKPILPPEAGDEPGGVYVTRRTDLPADEARVQNAAADTLERDPSAAIAAYRERFQNVVAADLAKEVVSTEYAASNENRSKYARAVQGPSSTLARGTFRRMLDETRDQPGNVVFTAGGTGSGKTSGLDLFPSLKAKAEIIYDSTLASKQGAGEDIDAALGAGKQVGIVFTYRDVEKAFRGVLGRTATEGRTVTLGAHARTHARSIEVVRSLMNQYRDNPSVQFMFVDNNGDALHKRSIADAGILDGRAYNVEDVQARLRTILEAEHDAGRVSDAIYHATLGTEAPSGDLGAAAGVRAGSGGRRRETASDQNPSPVDTLSTGEAQPRLPGASGARKVGKADVTFKAPQQASGDDFMLGPIETPEATARRKAAESPDLFKDSKDGDDVLKESVGSPTRRAFSEAPKSPIPVTPRELVRPSDLTKRISALFDSLPIKTRRFREHAFGIYKPKEHVIRLKVENDLATLSHELGHHVDMAIFGKDLPYGFYKEELLALGRNTSRASDNQKTKLREGAAEFFRLYLAEPVEAKRQAPQYFAAFEEAVEGSKEWGPAIRETQKLFADYLAQDLATRGEARIDFTGTDKTQNVLQRLLTEPGEAGRGFISNWVDDLAEAQRVVAALEKESGEPVDFIESAYVLSRLARGAPGKAKGFTDFGPRAADGTFLAGSLKEAVSHVAKEKQAFSKFLVALRVVELRGRGIETGISTTEAKAILDPYVKPGYITAIRTLDATRAGEKTGVTVAEAELAVQAQIKDGFEHFDRARAALYAYQDGVVKYAVQRGALSGDQAHAMRRLNRFYVPFQRVLDATSQRLTGTSRSIANRSIPVKRIKGSGKDIINPLESIVRNTYAIVDMVEKNRAMLALVDQASNVKGSGKFIERIPDPQIGTKFNLSQVSGAVRKALEDAGVDLEEALPDGGALDLDEMVTVFTPSQFVAQGTNVVSVIRNGKREWYSVNDQALYDTITAVGPKAAGWALALSGPASWLRAGATLTLGFIGTNPARDTWGAAVQSRYGFLPVVDTARGLFSYLKADTYYQEFLDSGAANSALVSVDRDQVRNEVKRLTSGPLSKWIPRTPLEALRALSEASELATRLGEFRRGLKAEGSTPEGKARAALATRDVTLDFSRAGLIGRDLNRTKAFFNAGVQGWARIIDLAREDYERARTKKDFNPFHYATGRAAIYVSLMSALVWAINKDDEEYGELKAWRKALFWHFPVGRGRDHHWVMIPKPPGWGQVFGTTTEAALDFIRTKDPASLRHLFPDSPWELLRNSALAVFPDAIAKPMEVIANYDTFRDRNIVSPFDTDLPPELQYSRWTTETSKLLGDLMKVSPAKIDHIVYGYTGGLGGGLWDAPSYIGRATGAGKAPALTIEDIPLVGRFYRGGAGTQSESLTELYEAAKLLTASERSVRIYAAKGENNKAQDVIKNLGPSALRGPDIKAAMRDLRGLRPLIDEVYSSKTLTPAQKREQLDRIGDTMLDIARRALGKPPLQQRRTS